MLQLNSDYAYLCIFMWWIMNRHAGAQHAESQEVVEWPPVHCRQGREMPVFWVSVITNYRLDYL